MTTLAPPARTLRACLLAAVAMACVGSSVAVSTTIVDAPLFTLQAVRYAMATVVLLGIGAVTRRSVPRPRGREWGWLAAVAASGLVLFNVAIVRGVEHAEPAVIGVAVAAVPLVLAVVGPIATGRRPRLPLVLGAGVVTVGAVLVEGGGRADPAGLAWAGVVLACEAGFTLFAVPVLGRLGAWGVSLHSVWMAAVGLAMLGVVTEGPAAVRTLDVGDWLAAGHLAVVVTALAFLLWYSAVTRLGAGTAGLFTGVVPVAAAVGGVLLGGAVPHPLVWVGTAVVAGGLALGLSARRVGSAGGPLLSPGRGRSPRSVR